MQYPRQDWSHQKYWSKHIPKGWRGRYKHSPRLLFLRLSVMFGIIALLFIGGVGALAFIMTRLFGGNREIAMAVWMVALALACILPVLAFLVAGQAFRRIARPLGNIMSAADSVAEGDLSVRVPENGPGDFARLSRSFNHMINELEHADQQRRSLTADVAHELRTPLHIIQGNLEGILDGVYQPTPEQIEVLLDETRSLSRLVDDLQILSQVETGQLPLECKPVSIVELLGDIQTSFSGQAEAAGVDLDLEIDTDPNVLIVCGDAGRLDQVLSNLVANALRYTPGGGRVKLHAEIESDWVRITVSDTGVGISPEDLEYVFDRFWKGDRVRTHQKGVGSGLGLAISKKLVEAQGGDIRVESQVGVGSRFIIELPVDK